jgi:hypothetical protein
MRTTAALAAAACLALPLAGAAAEAPAVVTLVESQATLLRSTGRFALAEGVRLQPGDIVEVGEKGLVQIGFADAAKVSLGPHSRFHIAALAPAAGGADARPAKAVLSDFYLLQGWSKFSLGKPAPVRLTTPLFGLGAADAVAVLYVATAEASVFVEKGELRLTEGFVKATPASPVQVRTGQFYARRAGQNGSVQARPATAFLAGMPKPYQDNLPDRLAPLKDREVAPRRLGDLAYSDVETWLKGPPELRRPLMQRLRARARDAEFRSALIANMPSHPEWDRILFPDKYKPKPPP